MAWPLKPNRDVPQGTFKTYLSSIAGLAESSVKQHLRCLSYFYGMFDLPKEFPQEAFMVELYRSGKIIEWVTLDLADAELPTTRNLHAVLEQRLQIQTPLRHPLL